MRRVRWATVAWGAIPVAALTALLTFDHIPGTDISLAVPYAAQGPGPMFDTLGDVQGEPVVAINGAETDETSGTLNMTTVSVRTNMTLTQALSRWITTDDTIVPVDQVLPPDLTQEELREYNEAAFVASEASATVAAMHYLGKPTVVIVHDVVEGSAADGHLQPEDAITRVDGKDVTKPGEVQEIVRSKQPGDSLEIAVSRGGSEVPVTVTLGASEADKNTAMLGILMTSTPGDGVSVAYNLNDVGGPSAGMIFALAVIDKLSPGELTHGRVVAGTGTIDESGQVGPIGGITHKIAGARDGGVELFLAPEGNCKEAAKANAGDMTVAKVADLDDAVRAMDDFAAGRPVTSCAN
ncbi:YlbL family protein [Corynebacterium sp. Marseille-Q4381]|uniref:YlbL family protein n=1 Tax=Corynebacterium sp. Marseille-Q4381 TaxID=3121597 RepID=UPI003FA53750